MKSILWGVCLFSMVAAAEPLPVFDQDFPCTTQEKADQYVKDLNIDLDSFGGMELCDSKVDTKKLFNDLGLIEDGKFQGDVSNVFIQNVADRNDYLGFLKSRTRGVRRGNDNPTATAYNAGGYFTMQDGWTKLSTLGRVGVVIHEARHTDGYGHRYCTHGPYADSFTNGCDKSVQEGGAHGAEMEYYSRVTLQGTNFHPAYQSMARLMNIARANFVFNDNPVTKSETLVAQSNDKLIQLRGDRRLEFTMVQKTGDTDRLKRTSAGVSLLTANFEVHSLDLTDPNPTAPMLDTYSYYKLLLNNAPQTTLSDLEEFDVGNKRFFFAASDKGRIYSFIYSRGNWDEGATELPNFARFAIRSPEGKAGIFAIFTTGQYCELDLVDLVCTAGTKTWPQDAKAFVESSGRLLELNKGQVLDAQSRQPFEALKNDTVQNLVEAPTYDVFEL